ncbi:hypothetical protein KM043_008335 [Ampulex compressa]|nr:hypothetical protein KM043_008335 [Ampulex compressa]
MKRDIYTRTVPLTLDLGIRSIDTIANIPAKFEGLATYWHQGGCAHSAAWLPGLVPLPVGRAEVVTGLRVAGTRQSDARSFTEGDSLPLTIDVNEPIEPRPVIARSMQILAGHDGSNRGCDARMESSTMSSRLYAWNLVIGRVDRRTAPSFYL